MNRESSNSLAEKKLTYGQEGPVFGEETLNQEEVAKLQEDIFSVSDSDIENHKIFWQTKLDNPELNDLVEALFALPAVFKAEQMLDTTRKALEHRDNLSPTEKHTLRDNQITALRELSEALGAFSHYLMLNTGNTNELKTFWQIYENYGVEKDAYSLFNEIRSGILGQAATEHLIQSLGLHCSAATWEEDVFEGTDLIISNNGRAPNVGRLQVKYKHAFDKVEIINVKEYDPSFSVQTELNTLNKNLAHFIPDASFDNLKRSCSADELAYYIRIPDKNPDGSTAVDPITGIPPETLVQEFQTESQRIFQNNFTISK